jgi:hypothetical protein
LAPKNETVLLVRNVETDQAAREVYWEREFFVEILFERIEVSSGLLCGSYDEAMTRASYGVTFQ